MMAPNNRRDEIHEMAPFLVPVLIVAVFLGVLVGGALLLGGIR